MKSMSKQCDIVRDILPLYVDGACSEASAEMVKEHLNACADCNAIYQKLLSHTSEDVLHEESESVIMRHEAKEKQRGRKKITIAVLVSIALCTIAIFTALFLLPINIAYEPVKIDFPFEVEDVENVEMYHYDGVPASAEKKVVVAENDIKTLYDKFKGLSLKDKTTEETAGADVTSFRFNLSDGPRSTWPRPGTRACPAFQSAGASATGMCSSTREPKPSVTVWTRSTVRCGRVRQARGDL